MTVVGWNIGKEVQADGEVQVARIEIDEMVCAPGRDVVEKIFGEVAMGIDQADAVASGDMLDDQVAEQGSLARTRLADDIDVVTAIGRGKTKNGGAATPVLALTYIYIVVVHDAQASRHSSRPRQDPA